MKFLELNADILPAKDDQIFKSLLTRNEPEAKIVLMDLISNIIGRKVTDVIIKNNEPATLDTSQKQERLDVNCVIDGNENVNLEMQASYIEERGRGHRNLINKSCYYGCDIYSGQGIKGKSYDELSKTYQITFCAYTIFKNRDKFINEFKFRNEDGETLTDDLSIIFIELSKLKEIIKKPVTDMTPLEMWSIFFEYADDPRQRDVINKIIEVKEEIAMAGTLLQSISQDDFERARFMSRRKYESDMESNMITALYNAAAKTAANLLKLGIKPEDVAKGTELPIEKVIEIKKELDTETEI